MVTANGLTYQYDKVGNLLRAYNGSSVEFFYDANHNRYLKKSSDGSETFYFGKTYERISNSKTGDIQHKHFVYADGYGNVVERNSYDTWGKKRAIAWQSNSPAGYTTRSWAGFSVPTRISRRRIW